MGLPTPVISSGGIMLRETISQNRYSYDESRNLSCGREYRAFYSLRCFAAPASLRRIHPPAFGLPPFGLKGRRFDGQAKRLLYSGQTWTSYAGCPSSRGNLLTGILNRWGGIHQNAGPWRRAAPKAQDGCGEADDSV